MPRTVQRAKLLPSLLGVRTVAAASRHILDFRFTNNRKGASATAAPIPSLAIVLGRRAAPRTKPIPVGEGILFEKGSATSAGFRPSYWSYLPQS